MRQDYILRQIEMIARLIAAIIARRRAGETEEAGRDIETQCMEGTGLSLATVQGLSPEALLDFTRQSGGQWLMRALLLAELLIQDAELSRAAGRHAGMLRSQVQAFCLLAEVVPALPPEDQPACRVKLGALAQDLDVFRDDPYVAGKLEAWDRMSAD